MLQFWLWLYSLPDISSRTIVALRERWWGRKKGPDVAEIIDCVSQKLGRRIDSRSWERKGESIERELQDKRIKILPYWADDYPKLLREIPDFPAFIFYKGRWRKSWFENSVSIVGTRKMSEYGRNVVVELVKPLVNANVTIVSGLAVGVDACAHLVALSHSKDEAVPVAVLAGGPEDGYPVQNEKLYTMIVQHGAVVWEHLPGTSLSRGMFASRNRIMAGLSRAVVVVESAEKGGSLITADVALQYNREVCAVPGSIFNETSVGTNELIRQGAHLVRNGYDVLNCIGVENISDSNKDNQIPPFIIELLVKHLRISTSVSEELIAELKNDGITLDNLSKKVDMDAGTLRSVLTKLEVAGILRLVADGTIKLMQRLL